MRVLVLGGTGMFGHKLCQVLGERFEIHATVRGAAPPREVVDPTHVQHGVSAEDFQSVVRAFAETQPAAVVNCIGIVKQVAAAKDPVASIKVNALFPHRLATLCAAVGSRLIQISTDCVFSGAKGYYTEDDVADALDLYGRTKLLGEVIGEYACTIRTSIIGRELQGSHGLLEWFLAQSGETTRGFRRAIFSGLTTIQLSEEIAALITRDQPLTGLWHVAADPISKFDLLRLVRGAYGIDVQIEPDDSVILNRSLDDTRYRRATESEHPKWSTMIDDLARDPTPYAVFRDK